MALSPLSTSFNLVQETGKLRDQLSSLQLQLATGKKATTYSELGLDRSLAISLRSKISSIDGYKATISQTLIRVDLIQEHLNRLEEIAGTTKSSAFGDQFELVENGKTQLQLTARSNLDEAVSLLNFELSGTHYFSGKTTDTKPVIPADQILNGIGAQAGFKQVLTERNAADLGASGLGRIAITTSTTVGPPSENIQLTEDGVHPFGFKLSAITSNLTGVTATGPAGAPAAVDVAFTSTLPQSGETISISLNLPDGTNTTLTLEATAGTAGANQFTIGADEATTRNNFQTAVNAKLLELANTDLKAASSAQAGENFFNFDAANPPQRVAGPPFNSATALVNATPADTVFWYQGDLSTGSARDSSIVRIDQSISLSFGARADEDALRTVVQNLALLAAETFSASAPGDQERYGQLRNRVSNDLSFNPPGQSILQIIAEFGQKQGVMGDVRDRHIATENTTGEILGDIENAEAFEVSSQILQLQTRLEASFQISSRLSELSLLNFL